MTSVDDIVAAEGSIDASWRDADTLRRAHWSVAIAIALVLGSHLPFLILHFRNLWNKPHYQFFPLLLLGIVWLAWRRWPRSGFVHSWSWSGALFLLFGLAVMAASVLLFSPWLCAIAALIVAGAVILGTTGRHPWRDWLPVWILLWLLIPPPLGWDEQLIQRFQSTTSRASSLVLDVAGVRHVMEGSIFVLPGSELRLEEASSGVDPLGVLFAIAAILVVATKRPLIWSVLLLSSSVVWAFLVCLGHAVITVLAQTRYGVELLSSWQHVVLALSLLCSAILMLVCTDRLLAFLLGPVDAPGHMLRRDPFSRAWNWCVGDTRSGNAGSAGGTSSAEGAGQPEQVRAIGRLPHWLIAGSFVLLGILQLLCLALGASQSELDAARTALLHRADLFAQSDSPATVDGWTLVRYSTAEPGSRDGGRWYFKTWDYRSDSQVCSVAIGHPYRGWHELGESYLRRGWSVVTKRAQPNGSESAATGDMYVEVEMTKPADEHGVLLYSLFDPAGVAVASTDMSDELPGQRRVSFSTRTLQKMLRNPLCRQFRHVQTFDSGYATWLVLAFVASQDRLSTAERESAQRLFLHARQELLSAYAIKQRRLSHE